MIDAERSLDGIGRAEHHRILPGKLCGIPTEITHFKALSITLPVIPCCQLRPEQPQGLLRELVHLCVKSVVFQLAVQFLLFDFQFPPLLNFRNAVFSIEYFVQFFGKRSCFPVYLWVVPAHSHWIIAVPISRILAVDAHPIPCANMFP